jgi:hypothetical protein
MKPESINTCGECRACCVVLPIADTEIVKPAGEPCHHLNSSGCGIYQTADWPRLCREYLCIWRQDKWLGKRSHYRPDKIGVVFQSNATVLSLFEVYPGALQSPQVQYIKSRLRGRLIIRSYPVGVLDGVWATPDMVDGDGTAELDANQHEWEDLGGQEYILRTKCVRIPLPLVG